LTNPNDYIQIAKCDELIDPNSMEAMKLRQERIRMQKPFIPINQAPFPDTTPHIHVNPVIKIVNGDDNSTAPLAASVDNASAEQAAAAENATFSSLQIQNPMKAGAAKDPAPPKPNAEKTIGGALMDLKNVVINKLTG
jgi:hypothetical protein